jgi:hypothetical protein
VDTSAKDDCNKEACHSSEKNICPVDVVVQEVIQGCAWKYKTQINEINFQETKGQLKLCLILDQGIGLETAGKLVHTLKLTKNVHLVQRSNLNLLYSYAESFIIKSRVDDVSSICLNQENNGFIMSCN